MWRALTEADLLATLSATEISTYRQSARGADASVDPVADLLSRTAQMVRGYVRAGGRVAVAPGGATIPEGLVSPACDYAAYDVLKRLPVAVGEDRRRAREQAIELFERVAAGKVTPESEDGEGSADAPPRWRRRRMILD